MSRLKSLSESERKELAEAVAETATASPEEIRQILARNNSPVTSGLATLVSRVRSDLVVLFVSGREIGQALAVPTTRIMTQKDLKELVGLRKEEAEAMSLSVTTEGYVKFGDTFVCVRDKRVQEIVVKEKANLALAPARQPELYATEVRSKLPKSEPSEEFAFTQTRSRGLD